MSVVPEIAVTTEPVVIEQEPSCETRRRLRERKTGPDGPDAKDAEGEAALGDPASIRSWLPCRDMKGSFFLSGARWAPLVDRDRGPGPDPVVSPVKNSYGFVVPSVETNHKAED